MVAPHFECDQLFPLNINKMNGCGTDTQGIEQSQKEMTMKKTQNMKKP